MPYPRGQRAPAAACPRCVLDLSHRSDVTTLTALRDYYQPRGHSIHQRRDIADGEMIGP